MMGFSVAGNLSGPLFLAFMPMDAFIWGGVLRRRDDVFCVLREGADAKVLFSIV